MTSTTRTVLFLCSGNYYRSRFAEHLFNAIANRDRLSWQAESRGLVVGHANNIGPISRFAVDGLKARGIDLNGDVRPPLQVLGSDFENASVIVALKEAEHRVMLAELFPDWANRVQYWHVHDLDCAEPDDALTDLENEVSCLVARLSGHDAPLLQEKGPVKTEPA